MSPCGTSSLASAQAAKSVSIAELSYRSVSSNSVGVHGSASSETCAISTTSIRWANAVSS